MRTSGKDGIPPVGCCIQLHDADIRDGRVDIGQELGCPRTRIRGAIVNVGSHSSVDPVGHTTCLDKY